MEIKNINPDIEKIVATVKKIAKDGDLFKKALFESTTQQDIATYACKELGSIEPAVTQLVEISRYSDVQQPEQAIDSMLYVLDLYVKELGKHNPEGKSLVALHEQLASLERSVDSFKFSYRDDIANKPALKEIVDTLEGLIYVQRYKLNRGDYTTTV